MNNTKSPLQQLIECVLIFPLLIITLFYNGYALKFAYITLILPIFPTLPIINICQAIGISTFLTALIIGPYSFIVYSFNKIKADDDLNKGIFTCILTNGLMTTFTLISIWAVGTFLY